MHLVLQQEWINGKSCLVEAEQLEVLLDILNLSSEKVGKQREAALLFGQEEQEYSIDWEENSFQKQEGLAYLSEEPVESQEEHEMPVAVEVVIPQEELSQEIGLEEEQRDENPVLEPDERETIDHSDEGYEVITWYYWPNGSFG